MKTEEEKNKTSSINLQKISVKLMSTVQMATLIIRKNKEVINEIKPDSEKES